MERDYQVKDMSLAEWGRKDIELSEVEMPGLMSCREEFKDSLKGARITGSLHMTIQTACLVETLQACGAESIRWCSCNIFSTQDHAAAAMAESKACAVFAWKGESLLEYWQCTAKALIWPDGSGPHMIVDDGGDATMFLMKGREREIIYQETGELVDPMSFTVPEEQAFWTVINATIEKYGTDCFKKLIKDLVGISEETTTGVMRLYQLQDQDKLLCPCINVNDSVTKSKFDNNYGCRHSLPDALNRATDVMIAGKKVLVCGYGDVGKGSAMAMKNCGGRVFVTEVDPICALQACMEGFEVVRLEDVLDKIDIFVTATGNRDIITTDHIQGMKNNAIVCNIGHFDNEIQIDALAEIEGVTKVTIKDQVHRWVFKDGKGVIVLAEGRLVNLGCATGHPSFVMSNSFTNQTLAQIELWAERNSDKYENKVYKLPRHLDEKVAMLHLGHLGAKLTQLKPHQAEYINVPQEGPFKKDDYKY